MAPIVCLAGAIVDRRAGLVAAVAAVVGWPAGADPEESWAGLAKPGAPMEGWRVYPVLMGSTYTMLVLVILGGSSFL